jgi:hypothetical protein
VSNVEGDNPRVTAEEMAANWTGRAILLELVRRQEDGMAAIDDLRAAVEDLQSNVSAEGQALSGVAQQLTQAEQQLTALQTAGVDNIAEQDLEAITATIAGVAQQAQAAVANLNTTGGVAPALPTDPGTVDPGTGAPVDPGTAGTPTDPVAPTDPTAGSPVDPTATDPAGGVAVSADRTLYVTTNDPATIDPATWPAAPVETSDDPPRQLYFFAGDTDAGQTNGSSVAGFEVYDGATQSTVAAGGGAAPDAGVAPDAGAAEG